MLALLHESLAAGGMGFSSTSSASHSDHLGQPVPSRFATDDEFVALAGAVADHPGTTIEFIPAASARFTDAEIERMTAMSIAGQRALNWNVMVVASAPLPNNVALTMAHTTMASVSFRISCMSA